MVGLVEIPKGSKYKYEIHDGALTLNRTLNQEIPFCYGYVPNTICGDGDELDVFIISQDPIPPMTEVFFTVVGILQCEDNGKIDDKVIGVLEGEEHLHDLDAAAWNIRNFLTTYKPGFKIESYLGKEEALETIQTSEADFRYPPDQF